MKRNKDAILFLFLAQHFLLARSTLVYRSGACSGLVLHSKVVLLRAVLFYFVETLFFVENVRIFTVPAHSEDVVAACCLCLVVLTTCKGSVSSLDTLAFCLNASSSLANVSCVRYFCRCFQGWVLQFQQFHGYLLIPKMTWSWIILSR